MTSASTSSSSAGVKRKALSIDDKLRIIKLYDEKIGVFNKQQIADQLGLPSSSLRTILKNRKEIEKNAFSGSTKRQKVRNGKNEQLENILLEWFRQARTLNLAVNGPVLTEKANEIAKRLNITDFGGSNGWLDRFRKRHGIVYRKICGEADAVDDNSIKSWKETILPNLLKDYSPEDIYNADEFGLFFKLMPDKSLVMKDETCHGGKLSKDRLTVLTCSNWSGTDKLKLLVIGKSKSPRCFKNVHTLPCDYKAQNRAWMTGSLIIEWVQQLNCKFVKQKRNVLLFVDNCPAHPKEITLTNIKLVFFPPNATSKLQPLDQGVIKVLKQKYRKKLVQRYLLEMESVTDAEIPKINVLDAIHYVSIAWDEIKPEVIKNCFNKAYFDNVSQEDPHVLDSDEFRDFEEVYPGYTSIDDQLITNEALELEEIINQATVNDEPDEPSDDEEEYIPPLPSIASTVQSISTLRQALTATDGSENMLLYLGRVENFLLNKYKNNVLKQPTITTFFNPRK
ncbi:unnamed protein product [Macrosiphum euphorbiae]|uniref:HTH CENPB-type domain-containing protein n=1 Tax=Macrosiphum euphorbiae TaxID=13131 RepID=A0AAV0VYF9_9HEMI|nr:unnamed protein product [Macrosiphum euphorbiae]